MSRRAALVPFLAFACLGAIPATPPAEYYGILTDGPQALLRREWEAQPVGDVRQVERAYCVTGYHRVTLPSQGGSGPTIIYVVTDLGPATVAHPMPWQIADVVCPTYPDGANAPTVYTHPASACNTILGTCVADSTRMRVPGECKPSAADLRTLHVRRLPFSIVQCGPGLTVFYGPAADVGADP